MEANSSLPNVVANELRSLIVRGTLLPGEHLGQTQLAERFGRSKVPIREALKLLATEGFLRHDRNRGYFVAPLEIDEARQLYKLRRWLEAQLLETAEWPDAATIADLREQLAQDLKAAEVRPHSDVPAAPPPTRAPDPSLRSTGKPRRLNRLPSSTTTPEE